MYVMGYRVPAFVLVGFIFGTIAAFLLKRFLKKTSLPARRSLSLVGLVWYLPIVLAITLAPRDSGTYVFFCSTSLSADFYAWAQEDQRLLNVLMFIPLGFFIPLIVTSKKQFFAALLLLSCLPVLIEFLQTTFINRSCDVNDIFDNLSGIFLGCAVGALTKVASNYFR